MLQTNIQNLNLNLKSWTKRKECLVMFHSGPWSSNPGVLHVLSPCQIWPTCKIVNLIIVNFISLLSKLPTQNLERTSVVVHFYSFLWYRCLKIVVSFLPSTTAQFLRYDAIHINTLRVSLGVPHAFPNIVKIGHLQHWKTVSSQMSQSSFESWRLKCAGSWDMTMSEISF